MLSLTRSSWIPGRRESLRLSTTNQLQKSPSKLTVNWHLSSKTHGFRTKVFATTFFSTSHSIKPSTFGRLKLANLNATWKSCLLATPLKSVKKESTSRAAKKPASAWRVPSTKKLTSFSWTTQFQPSMQTLKRRFSKKCFRACCDARRVSW